MKKFLWLMLLFFAQPLYAQQLAPLTVQKIMRDPKWIGTSPSNVFWSPDSRKIYFNWNPQQSLSENESIYVGGNPGPSVSDSLYEVTLQDPVPRKVPVAERKLVNAERYGSWNNDHSQLVFSQENSLYLLDITGNKPEKLLQTTDRISHTGFSFNGNRVVYQLRGNLYSRDLKSGQIQLLTDFREGKKRHQKNELTPQDRFLQGDALDNSRVLRQRKRQKEATDKALRAQASQSPKTIYLGDKDIDGMTISPDGRFVVYRLKDTPKDVRYTQVPDYVTSSGYTENMRGRPLAGTPQPSFKSYVYDRDKDSVVPIAVQQIPGIRDLSDYLKDYRRRDSILKKDPPVRSVMILDPVWNKRGSGAFVVIRSLDHKDRWIMLLDAATGKLRLLDRQRDEAWIGGPGIGSVDDQGSVGWIGENTVWYQSGKSGYSHLYTVNTVTGEKKVLTSGTYEVQQAELSRDGKTFYISTNKVEPGQTQFYRLDIATGTQTRITTMKGGNVVTVSPDGKHIAFLYSTAVHPWELYVQQNKPYEKAIRITDKAESAAYRSYPWRKPDIITFKDRDGLKVYASVFKPDSAAPTHPGVLFVHGAGYLQDVDRWWSYYFREHMFMNLLADQGYTVMDIDYRGSAGYGRDWRTAIYRRMGGNDLADEVDGAKYMVKQLGVNPRKIGIWGGSYGGFLTLMAMFKTGEFACGGALRSVTDWAHYNHGYTSAILNNPQDDSLAYVRSSPIYFADGLRGKLLMCHGMVDSNVHFQDIVRLTQKLIESGKHDWQLAVYPVESHDFKEASSWTDEYSRIYKLFETCLK
jgi:dipeptidyl aminopeptidase/acylaminoacyl peptidase